MRFRCHCCNEEWSTPKEKLVYINDWPDSCPKCESADISHEAVEDVIESSTILANVEKKLEKRRRETPPTQLDKRR